jgi:hypothetical protein
MSRRWSRPLLALLVAATAGSLLASCGSSSSGGGSASSTTKTTLLVTYGAQPTVSAKMICAPEIRIDVTGALNTQPKSVTTPTWVDHRYACTYVFPTGSFTLSVKELPNIPDTEAYFAAQKAKVTVFQKLPLGQDGFVATDGTSVVRKDNKVLVVDVAKLPAKFGAPPQDRKGNSSTIATLILGCWTGE